MKRRLALLLIVFLMSCTKNQDSHFPGDHWPQSTPEAQGIDSAALQHALDVLEGYCGQDGIEETVVIRNGFVVFRGDSVEKSHGIWSCTKSFTSTVLGLLIQDGVVFLNDKAWTYEPLLEEKYAEVTLRHFATMTSGYNAVGRSRWGENSQDWSIHSFLPAEPLFAPGTAFAYWDEAMNMFGRVLTQASQTDLKQMLTERITDPIQLGSWSWWSEDSLNGFPIRFGSTGIEMNALQLARFGYLFLHKGYWDGNQLIDSTWVQQATTAQVPRDIDLADTDRKSADGRGIYGYNWWTNGIKPNGKRSMPNTPEQTFYASGFNNNMCFVIREWNMVVVRLGLDGNPPRGKAFVYDQFFAALRPGISDN